jgi:hypothetical protein
LCAVLDADFDETVADLAALVERQAAFQALKHQLDMR